jgi:ActR/RegA family two-component response regulator
MPAVVSCLPDASPPSGTNESPPVLRILIVDSDLNVCTSVSRTLTGLGYGLDVAYDADEARSLSRRNRYAVGLFGESLTDGDGVTLFRELCPVQQGMLGVLVASVANLPTVARAIGAGMSRVAPVPIDFHDLVQFLSSIPATASPAHRGGASMMVESRRGAYSESDIAELTPGDIAQRLTLGELIDVIRSVEYPFAGKDRLEFFDRDTLERVVHLVRRWCRNRLHRPAW